MDVPAAKPQARGGFTFSPPTAPAAGQPQESPEQAEVNKTWMRLLKAQDSVKQLGELAADLKKKADATKDPATRARLLAAFNKVVRDDQTAAAGQVYTETIAKAAAERRAGEAEKERADLATAGRNAMTFKQVVKARGYPVTPQARSIYLSEILRGTMTWEQAVAAVAPKNGEKPEKTLEEMAEEETKKEFAGGIARQRAGAV